MTKTTIGIEYIELLLYKRRWHLNRYFDCLNEYNRLQKELEERGVKGVSYNNDPIKKSNINNKNPQENKILLKETYKFLADKNLKEVARIDNEENLKNIIFSNLNDLEKFTIDEHVYQKKTFAQLSIENGGTKETHRIRYVNALEKISKGLEYIW